MFPDSLQRGNLWDSIKMKCFRGTQCSSHPATKQSGSRTEHFKQMIFNLNLQYSSQIAWTYTTWSHCVHKMGSCDMISGYFAQDNWQDTSLYYVRLRFHFDHHCTYSEVLLCRLAHKRKVDRDWLCLIKVYRMVNLSAILKWEVSTTVSIMCL